MDFSFTNNLTNKLNKRKNNSALTKHTLSQGYFKSKIRKCKSFSILLPKQQNRQEFQKIIYNKNISTNIRCKHLIHKNKTIQIGGYLF